MIIQQYVSSRSIWRLAHPYLLASEALEWAQVERLGEYAIGKIDQMIEGLLEKIN